MKVTKGIRKQLFLNTYNNSTIWDYYKEKITSMSEILFLIIAR